MPKIVTVYPANLRTAPDTGTSGIIQKGVAAGTRFDIKSVITHPNTGDKWAALEGDFFYAGKKVPGYIAMVVKNFEYSVKIAEDANDQWEAGYKQAVDDMRDALDKFGRE